MTLRAFDHAASPPWVVNVTGPERLSVRAVAERFGRLMDRPVRFTGTEADTALLSDAHRPRAPRPASRNCRPVDRMGRGLGGTWRPKPGQADSL